MTNRSSESAFRTPPAEAGRRLARAFPGGERRGSAGALGGRLDELERQLRSVHRAFHDSEQLNRAYPRVAEWLLDNEYLSRRALSQVREDVPPGFFRELPAVAGEPGKPAVAWLAERAAQHLGHRLEAESLASLLEGYQDVRPLAMGELWALPAFLRLALLERLRAVTEPLVSGAEDEGGGVRASADGGPRGEGVGSAGRPVAAVVEACIESLRWLEEEDWEAFFERASLVEAVLRGDPSGHYPRMDFASRDRYRKAVEELARGSDRSEIEVAREAVEAARSEEGADERFGHVGRFLVGEGREALEARTGSRSSPRTRRLRWIYRRARPLYFGAVALVGLLLLAPVGFYAAAQGVPMAGVAGLVALAVVPAVTVAVSVANWVVTHALPARVLPKLELEEALPEDCRTAVVVPCLFTDRAEVEELLERLEVHYQGNDERGFVFALLSDFGDAPRREMPGDDALLEAAVEGVRALNRRHGQEGRGPFLLLHRAREWNPSEDRWMGWERKRGKLEQFNRMVLEGEEEPFAVREGDTGALQDVRFVITLDADTRLPPGAATRLVGTLAHPLNLPVVDRQGRVRSGYTVLQPRLETAPAATDRTPFARIYQGERGLDLYTHAVSDVYMDLFGEGIYSGKGIYHLEGFARSVAGRVPEDALLSHDLFEGLCGRAGLVSDIQLFEEYPSHLMAYMGRLHRWVRGDWQWLPWLLPRVPAADGRRVPNPFSALDRWKLADNLRRSLLAPSLVTLLAAGWLGGAGSAWAWTGLALSVVALPTFLGAATATTRRLAELRSRRPGRRRRITWRSRLAQAGRRLREETARWLLVLTFLPHEAAVVTDAVARTLVRLYVTRRRLLEWTSAAQAARAAREKRDPVSFWRNLRFAPLLGASTLAWALLLRPAAGAAVAVLAVPWLVAPQVGYLVSRVPRRREVQVSSDDVLFLRQVALRTWFFFERFLESTTHWLPPDNYRETEGGRVADRTSPTNIGLYLAATGSAYDLGYLGPLSLEAMVRNTAETMGRLERHRGHFLNWYGTRDLASLEPRYVSTVDSGNLAASLVAVEGALAGLRHDPVVTPSRGRGLRDVVRFVDEVLDDLRGRARPQAVRETRSGLEGWDRRLEEAWSPPERLAPLVLRMEEELLPWLDQRVLSLAGDLEEEPADADVVQRLRIWSRRLRQGVAHAARDVRTFQPWLPLLEEAPAAYRGAPPGSEAEEAWTELRTRLETLPPLGEVSVQASRIGEALERLESVAEANGEAEAWSRRLGEALEEATLQGGLFLGGVDELRGRLRRWVAEMDFAFLYDRRRRLFHIGYDVDAGRLDPHHYDLLASEARLGSFLAMAKGDAPADHWIHLGRPFAPAGATAVLLSWGGTMFEYLLPAHFLRTPEDTLLDRACRAAVERQMRFGRRRNLPWGMSESAYLASGTEGEYGYRAFGVPDLSLRRELEVRPVVAPYACALALPFEPRATVANLRRLATMGVLGRYGFYEAVDFAAEGDIGRRRDGQAGRGTPVKAYMAHHQGMILVALNNFLNREPMVKRVHGDPRVRGLDYLLHEQRPWQVPARRPWVPAERKTRVPELPPPVRSWPVDPDSPVPHAHVLSNGRYRVVLTADGGGGSAVEDVWLTDWTPDPATPGGGCWIYLREPSEGTLWSATRAPAGAEPAEEAVFFAPDLAEFQRRSHRIGVRTRVCVPPDADAEIRRLTVSNLSDRPRRLQVATYAEVALAPRAGHRRHPAYSKLFVEAEWLKEEAVLVLRRRPRGPGERPLWWAHAVAGAAAGPDGVRPETRRDRFLGRGGDVASPRGLAGARAAGRESEAGAGDGFPLDPVASLTVPVELLPRGSRQLSLIWAAGASREEALSAVERFRRETAVTEAFRAAGDRAQESVASHGLEPETLPAAQALLSTLLRPVPGLRPSPERLAANRGGQRELWKFGVSGDLPILLVRLGATEELGLVSLLLRLHGYWRSHGVAVDLLVLDTASTGYAQPLRDRLEVAVRRAGAGGRLGSDGGIHVVAGHSLSPGDRDLLAATARAVLDGGEGSLEEQVAALRQAPDRLPGFVPVPTGPVTEEATPPLPPAEEGRLENGWGGFADDGGAYRIRVEPDRPTPAPWTNVLTNPEFGCLVSESSLGSTWAGHAALNRLTPWRNDPVVDRPAEVVYLRDEETAELWSATPAPCGADVPYRVTHRPGSTAYRHHSHGLEHRLRVFVSPDAPVKLVELELQNRWSRGRRLTVTYYAEWVLGDVRERAAPFVVSEYDAGASVLLARNPFTASETGGGVAFLGCSAPPHGVTADRREFLGSGGLRRPSALARIGLSGSVVGGDDPCAAYQAHVDLPPHGTTTLRYVLGQGADREEAVRLAARYSGDDEAGEAREAAAAAWRERLDVLTVRTPEPALDVMLNGWLTYQTTASRLHGRTALYQSSGAFGFRDQLQDVTSLFLSSPDESRRHILRAAARQFVEGDVLHWWHPGTNRGVRTRCSDDLLWLPYVTAEYVTATGDRSILEEGVPYLEGAPLEEGQDERYADYGTAPRPGTLYEHCLRALERGTTEGPHGLPLMGSGDWNDGMNRVGAEGRGESVWLGWFLMAVLDRFAPICEGRDETGRAKHLRLEARRLRERMEEAAWDGGWYLRAFYDDGSPLGTAADREARIDAVSQAWAVLSGAARPERAARAMEAAWEHLVREDDGLVLLLTPPFRESSRDPGYIGAYPPGVRENGGQYSHAAAWLGLAFAELGDAERAFRVLQLLNPASRAATQEQALRYRTEPYATAADVYGVAPYTGRGGWTWYTGSAAWTWRLGVEGILGLRLRDGALHFDPCVPPDWPEYEMQVRKGDAVYRIRVSNPEGAGRGVREVTMDGQVRPDGRVALRDDGREHEVTVRLGQPTE